MNKSNQLNESNKPSCIQIAACSYEGSLFGWNIEENESHDSLQANLIYGFNETTWSIKTITSTNNGKYIAFGGMEEKVKVYNINEKRNVAELAKHTGAITCLQFYQDKYLISGSEDKTICIWRIQDWNCIHVMQGHTGSILGLSIHPSGKICLSVSKDGTMRLWNLLTGTCAYTKRLTSGCEDVKWNELGDKYLLLFRSSVDVYDASDNKLLANILVESRINKALFLSIKSDDNIKSEAITIITENKLLQLYNINGIIINSLSFAEIDCGRLRDISICSPSSLGNEELDEILSSEGDCIVVATSNGHVYIVSTNAIINNLDFDSSIIVSDQLKAEPRLTCITAWSANNNTKKRSNSIDDHTNEFIEREIISNKNKKSKKNKT